MDRCGGCALGAAAAGAGGSQDGRVREDGHFVVRTTAALPALPKAPEVLRGQDIADCQIDMITSLGDFAQRQLRNKLCIIELPTTRAAVGKMKDRRMGNEKQKRQASSACLFLYPQPE